MKIDEIRIYAEVLEQGLDFKEYISHLGYTCPIKNIYTKKSRQNICENDTLVDKLRKVKDIDVFITVLSTDNEFPVLLVEYSTAVPTDDHKMQRSDVFYWSFVFKVPVMKISPASKGMNHEFGGGAKFTDEIEIALAYKKKAIFYPIHWPTETDKDILTVKEDALSCIVYTEKISERLNCLLECLSSIEAYQDYYDILLKKYQEEYANLAELYTHNKIKSLITHSSRFHWINDKLRIKINRFGHAMDPDRGILYFMSMLLGEENIITEIQVNRKEPYKRRGGYSSLFDSLSRESNLKKYVENIIKNGNIFSDEDALHIFKTALNIDDKLSFTKVADHYYKIDDDNLEQFLLTYPSITTKSIFFLSTELHLTDKDRNIICTIRWNKKPIDKFKESLNVKNYSPTNIKPLLNNDINEDIITYTSVELYKKLHYKLLAVSYPGAQGDRCVLTGMGRKALRTYVDIIAYRESNNHITVYLEECKKSFSSSKSDVKKLNDLKIGAKKYSDLKILFKKMIRNDDISSLYTSIAAKYSSRHSFFDVDYMFMFKIDNDCVGKTEIKYNVAIINTNLIDDFSVLKNSEGKMQGSIILDKIYKIK